MRLDMDAYRRAMDLPVLVVDGVEYQATALLTFTDAVRLQQQWQEDPSGAGSERIARDLCGLTGIPAEVVLGLPPAAMVKVITGFFAAANQAPPEPPA